MEGSMTDHGRYVEIPGERTHELPPLLVHGVGDPPDPEHILASGILEAEDMLPSFDEQGRFDLAVQLVEQYRGLISHWQWGDSILEWIRQCEITFDFDAALRPLLHPDLWPHASRSSFVTLLVEKRVPAPGVELEKAVGLRLTFRQPPPIDCFSNQFLFLLNSTVAGAAYRTWSSLTPRETALLPPERFHFDVVNMGN
jgi:hypothetical protein